jgi:uncharacterized membrane protein
MSVDVIVETAIGRPREQVARFAMDPANDTRWISALDSARTLTDGPFGEGTRVERVASFLGKRIEYVNEVVEHEPGRRLVMRSVKAPFPMTVTYEFEDAPAGTLARIRAEGDASGFYAVGGPLLARMVRRGIRKDLELLKSLLEAD